MHRETKTEKQQRNSKTDRLMNREVKTEQPLKIIRTNRRVHREIKAKNPKIWTKKGLYLPNTSPSHKHIKIHENIQRRTL